MGRLKESLPVTEESVDLYVCEFQHDYEQIERELSEDPEFQSWIELLEMSNE